MKKTILALCVGLIFCCSLAIGENWLTDGGDVQRSGWNKDEHILTKDNINNLKLLWKIETGNNARALHSLMTPLVVDSVPMSGGPKEVIYVEGVSDNLYAIDAKTGEGALAEALYLPASSGSRRRWRIRAGTAYGSEAPGIPAAWRKQRRSGDWSCGCLRRSDHLYR